MNGDEDHLASDQEDELESDCQSTVSRELDNDELTSECESEDDNVFDDNEVSQEEVSLPRPRPGPYQLRRHPQPSRKAREGQARD